MRNVAFLAIGLGLLVLQANLFRVLDQLPVWAAAASWLVALVVDTSRTLRKTPGYPRPVTTFRADWLLPATVLLGYSLLVTVAHARVGRPIPALVLPAHSVHGRARVFPRPRRRGGVRSRLRDGRGRHRAGRPLHVHVRRHVHPRPRGRRAARGANGVDRRFCSWAHSRSCRAPWSSFSWRSSVAIPGSPNRSIRSLSRTRSPRPRWRRSSSG